MPWFAGSSLIHWLETLDVAAIRERGALRFPVQWVNRPHLDFRGLAGTVSSGALAIGDRLRVASSGRAATLAQISTFDGLRASAKAGDAVSLVLSPDIDAGRGDVLVKANEKAADPGSGQRGGRESSQTLAWW